MAESITLKNNIPIIGFNSFDILSKRERQYSKFFRCRPTDNSLTGWTKCLWSGNDVHKFRQHIQEKHKRMSCWYCWANKSSDESFQEFTVDKVDTLVEHILKCHGRRQYQCNLCPYRAITATHIQMHHLSAHYPLWSAKNLTLDLTITAIDEPELDICKIIECRPIVFGPKEHLSVWMPRYTPNPDLEDDKYYCLYCDHCDINRMKVVVHCVQKHPDFDICVYNREELAEAEANDLSDALDTNQETEPKNGISNEVQAIDPYIQPLSLSLRTKLSLKVKNEIPGLDGKVDYRRPFKPKNNYRRDNRWSHRRQNQRFERNYRQPKPPANRNLDVSSAKNDKSNDDSNDAYFEDDINDISFEPGPSTMDSYVEPTPTPRPPLPPPTPMPGIIGNHNIGQIFGQTFETEVPNCPLAPTPVPPSPAPTPLPVNPPNEIHVPKRNRKKSKFGFKQKLQENESPSVMNYREYKLVREMEAAMNPSTSTSRLPPPIDLTQTERELAKESGLDRNSFKSINRVGVSTNRSADDEDDQYVNLVDETSKNVPKRGIKARFEAQKHFELIKPQANASAKNLLKCILCSTEDSDCLLKEQMIQNHLSRVHNTYSSLKCGFTDCEFINDKKAIIEHSKIKHPNVDPKVEKFIVPGNQNKPIGITCGSNLERTKTARKSTASGGGNVRKGAKGSLTQRIKDSTFLGPLRNETTGRKRTISESDDRIPYQRVYNRGTHSSNIRSKKLRTVAADLEMSDSEDENLAQDVEAMEQDISSDSDPEPVPSTSTAGVVQKQRVAKKSTAKASICRETPIIVDTEDISYQPTTKYFCVFCPTNYTFNDIKDAIEHYKAHLELGYSCNQCSYKCVEYHSMEEHWDFVHHSPDMDFEDNIPEMMNKWIFKFLEQQIKLSDLTDQVVPNSTGIHLTCPMCEKAAKVQTQPRNRLIPRSFDALWKAKLHICKHLNWNPIQCDLCGEGDKFPNHPYLLMKHLVDLHFTSVDNFHNISFRGQKPFNDMKRMQMALIQKHYSPGDQCESSQLLSHFFDNLMVELDVTYENQLRAKFKVKKEINIRLERCVVVKTEPVEQVLDVDENGDHPMTSPSQETEHKTEVKDEDKKDVKLAIKSEVKNEVKAEVKNEAKPDIKPKSETKSEEGQQPQASEAQDSDNEVDWFDDLYNDSNQTEDQPNQRRVRSTQAVGECIQLSSDED